MRAVNGLFARVDRLTVGVAPEVSASVRLLATGWLATGWLVTGLLVTGCLGEGKSKSDGSMLTSESSEDAGVSSSESSEDAADPTTSSESSDSENSTSSTPTDASANVRQDLTAYLDNLVSALCEHYENCELSDETMEECAEELRREIDEVAQCDATLEYFVANRSALEQCLSGGDASCDSDDVDVFCPALGGAQLDGCEPSDDSTPDDSILGGSDQEEGPAGDATSGELMTLDAQVVGAWGSARTTCTSGATITDYAVFLCPGGRIRGAGELSGNVTELICGTYHTVSATLSDCNDRYGCFDKVDGNVQSTLILAGESDVASRDFDLYRAKDGSLFMPVQCEDGTEGILEFTRVSQEITENYCVSDACPAPSGDGESFGECGTDCDCGRCWYCESGQCRFGGEGPYECYRGCSD